MEVTEVSKRNFSTQLHLDFYFDYCGCITTNFLHLGLFLVEKRPV